MLEKPTLEEQIRVSKMTDGECIKALTGGWHFWVFRHSELLWTILFWNWFDIWEGSENANSYRSWYMKLKIKLFG